MRPFMGITLCKNRLAASGSILWRAAMPRADMARFIERRDALALAEGSRMSVVYIHRVQDIRTTINESMAYPAFPRIPRRSSPPSQELKPKGSPPGLRPQLRLYEQAWYPLVA